MFRTALGLSLLAVRWRWAVGQAYSIWQQLVLLPRSRDARAIRFQEPITVIDAAQLQYCSASTSSALQNYAIFCRNFGLLGN
jgi:hypothetical protein